MSAPEDFGITGLRLHSTKSNARPQEYDPDRDYGGDFYGPYGLESDTVSLNGRTFGRLSIPRFGRQGALFGEATHSSQEQALMDSPDFDAVVTRNTRRAKQSNLPPPDASAKFGDYELTAHREFGGPIVHAWHQGRSVGRLDVGSETDFNGDRTEYDEYGSPVSYPERKTPDMISVHPEHRNRGVARAMFRFAQFVGSSENPQENLTHSDTQTPMGQAYSFSVPNDPDEDPSVPSRRSRVHQFRLDE